jgi:Ca2+-binding EF-hand superfamily protein
LILFAELRIAFSMFDKDGDGQITAQEVQDTMRSLGIHVEPNQIQLIVKKVDTDGIMMNFYDVLDVLGPVGRLHGLVCQS